jgi:mono/diheme cytochrome c family protein
MGIIMVSCNRPRRSTGHAYMPDMYYSRAYETYAGLDTSKFSTDKAEWGASREHKIFYNNQPVTGTVARGEMAAYPYRNDSTGYIQSAGAKNPLRGDSAVTIDMKEAERLYLVNCAICHGAKLDGNGPLWNGGNGPYPAAPKNLMGDDMKALTEGTIFHVATYGKGQMGSYASQLNTKQRWMVVAYIKDKQNGGKASAAATATDTTAAAPATAKPDSTAAGK